MTAVCRLQQRNGRGHVPPGRQGFRRQEGVVDGIKQQQRRIHAFQKRFAGIAAVVIVAVGKTVKRRGKAVVKIAKRFAVLPAQGRLKLRNRSGFRQQRIQKITRINQSRHALIKTRTGRHGIDRCGNDGRSTRNGIAALLAQIFGQGIAPQRNTDGVNG